MTSTWPCGPCYLPTNEKSPRPKTMPPQVASRKVCPVSTRFGKRLGRRQTQAPPAPPRIVTWIPPRRWRQRANAASPICTTPIALKLATLAFSVHKTIERQKRFNAGWIRCKPHPLQPRCRACEGRTEPSILRPARCRNSYPRRPAATLGLARRTRYGQIARPEVSPPKFVRTNARMATRCSIPNRQFSSCHGWVIRRGHHSSRAGACLEQEQGRQLGPFARAGPKDNTAALVDYRRIQHGQRRITSPTGNALPRAHARSQHGQI